MKYVLLVALLSHDGLEASVYYYAEEPMCVNVANNLVQQLEQDPRYQILEVWCYPYEFKGAVE